MTQIDFYCGIGETSWNHHPVAPGPLACIAPVKGKTERTRVTNRVFVPPGTQVIQDSGAFSDSRNNRMSFPRALTRQIRHAVRFRYLDKISHVASYDLLIDEKWQDGTRRKERWSEAEAWAAVQETVAAARWLASHRSVLPSETGLILSAQGVSPSQYLDCAERIFPYLGEGDVFGLGGWCVVGKYPAQMMPVFVATMQLIIPASAKAGVRRVHIWGVIYPVALAHLSTLCERYHLRLSTDSAGPTVAPVFGQWGYGSWRDNAYRRVPPERRGIERARHVALTRNWLSDFPVEEYLEPIQTSLFP